MRRQSAIPVGYPDQMLAWQQTVALLKPRGVLRCTRKNANCEPSGSLRYIHTGCSDAAASLERRQRGSNTNVANSTAKMIYIQFITGFIGSYKGHYVLVCDVKTHHIGIQLMALLYEKPNNSMKMLYKRTI